MFAPVVALLLAGGAPSQLAGFSLEVPAGFRADPELAQGSTSALAIADGEAERHLVALYRDDNPEPATLVLSSVESPLVLDASSKAALAVEVSSHFKRQLELPFSVDRTAFIPGAEPRVEVWGTVNLEKGPREVGVAFFSGTHRHTVAVASLPGARADALRPIVEATWSSLRSTDAPEPWAQRRTAVSVAVWGLAAVALLMGRWIRRRRGPS